MVGYRPFQIAAVVLLLKSALVLAEVAPLSIPLSHDQGALPYDCMACHKEVVTRMASSVHMSRAPGDDSQYTRCYLCHVNSGRDRRFAVVRDDDLKYLHKLPIEWSQDGRYRLQFRSSGPRGTMACPSKGAYVFDTRQATPAAAPLGPLEDQASRLMVNKVRLAKAATKAASLEWETNLKTSAEATYWQADTRAHMPLKNRCDAGMGSCRGCHRPEQWAVAHPVGIKVSAS
ncbi:MAG: hypothetical protein V2A77_02400, partial [Pseudomonadota bacterium]